jgi:hypothetical protein
MSIRRHESSSIRRRPIRRLWLPALGVGAMAVVAYSISAVSGTENTRQAASLSAASASAAPGTAVGGTAVGGWGRGGYPMVTGPAPAVADNAANAAASSVNWAGYAATGAAGTFTSVSTSWTQPAVTCSATNTFSSFWAGLDGDGSQTVEQTGTEADCSGGAATYAGWYEMFPNAPVFYNNPVDPGDAMSASVVANGGGAFTLTLSDATQGWTQTTHQTSATATLASAEVIAEAPSNGTVLPLANFGTVSFSNATANGAPIGNANVSELTMVSAGGTTEATPSALTGGTNFTVTWDSSGSSGATVPATGTPSPGASMTSPAA